jgi:hypothetical protein
MDIAFDRYLDNDELTDAISSLAAAHPNLLRVDSLGTSYEDRDIPLLVLTNAETGRSARPRGADARTPPAHWAAPGVFPGRGCLLVSRETSPTVSGQRNAMRGVRRQNAAVPSPRTRR